MSVEIVDQEIKEAIRRETDADREGARSKWVFEPGDQKKNRGGGEKE
jgi:hypothetical protein